MTYGWALLIIAIVAIALWKLGVFSPGRRERVIKNFLYLDLVGFGIHDQGNLSLEIVNTKVNPMINITMIKAEVPWAPPGTTANITPNYVLAINEKFSTDINLSAVAGSPCRPGTFYDIPLTVEFIRFIPGVGWTTTSTIDTATITVICR